MARRRETVQFYNTNKREISIHKSWFSDIFLAFIRIISLGLITYRYTVYSNDFQNSFIYLTFYSFILTWIYFIAVVSHFLLIKFVINHNSLLSAFTRDCVNLIYEVSFSFEITVTALYWSVLYSPSYAEAWGFMNLGVHLMPIVLVLFDLVFNLLQFPKRHLIITVFFGIIYIIINQVHTCNYKPVYQIYTCGNLIWPLIALFILSLAHLIGHLIWLKKLRKIDEIQFESNNSINYNQNFLE